MLARVRWMRLAVLVLALGMFGGLAAGCGGGGDGAQTGIIVYNNPVGPHTFSIVQVTIGGTPALVNIPVGGTLFMPTAPGSHLIQVTYNDFGSTNESGQNPPDPVVVQLNQVVTVDFVY